MKWRAVLRYMLLAAVVVAVASGIVKQTTGGGRSQPTASQAASGRDRTVVYYMHATIRCFTCNMVEATADDLIRSEYASALKDGSLEWKQVNYQEETDLASRYNVGGNTIIVVKVQDGKETKVRKLDEVMALAGKPEKLKSYIRQGIQGIGDDAAPTADVPTLWLAMVSALLLGLLTSISPCPLATNIAAISFLGRGVGNPRRVLMSGLLYTVGRTVVYVGLGAAILLLLQSAGSGSSASGVSLFLQKYMNLIVAPLLVLVGMLLLGLLKFTGSLNLAGQGLQERAAKGGAWWALVLGVLFALSFCPISAGLFFGSLIGLSGKTNSPVLVPTLYGIGTAVPVVAFAILMAFAAGYVGKAFSRLTQIEKYLRLATGVIFVGVGLYLLV